MRKLLPGLWVRHCGLGAETGVWVLDMGVVVLCWMWDCCGDMTVVVTNWLPDPQAGPPNVL